jgi:hypothetical protein
MTSQDKIMKYIQYLPPDMKYVIKTFIPISILKKVRKIKENELPIHYRIAKALNEHFYMTSVGYKLDINSVNNYINFLDRRLVHLNRKFNDTFNIHECCQLTTSKIVTKNLLRDKKKDLLLPTIMYYLHNEYYAISSHQLQSYNIIEVE